MSEERYNQNQTQFAVEEPLMELPVEPVMPPLPERPVAKTRPKWVLPAAGGVLLLLLVLLIVAARNKGEGPADTIPEPTLSAPPVLSPMEQRLEATKTLLKEANPTVQDLPFPPLDMKIRIDEK